MVKKHLRNLFLEMGIFLMLGINVLAAGEIKTVGSYTNEEGISLYIKGLGGDISSMECQIGTKSGQQVQYEKAEEMETAARTLIMIDNSLSITDKNREKIKSFLLEFAYDKPKEEQVALVTFSEQITPVTDFIADRRALEDAIESLTYQDQETYLTEVLYEAIEKDYLGTEDYYKRIIIISDGVDNKSIGYTKEELYTLIKEKSYPIYTIGCIYKSNNEQLENMFALSRITSGKEFLLDEVENTDDIVDAMAADNQIIHVKISPEDMLMDGGRKSVLLTAKSAEGEQKAEFEIRMPFKAEAEEITEEQQPEPVIEEKTAAEEETVAVNTDKNKTILLYIAAGGAAVIVVVIVIAAVICLRKKSRGKKKNDFEILEETVDFNVDKLMPDTEATVLINERNDKDENYTQLIWGDAVKQYNLLLTDTKNPGRSFQTPIKGSVIIGRKAGESNIVIEYEKSVSGRHCQISEKNGKFYVKDLQSSNGTMLNGVRILAEMELHSGSILTLGRLEMKVEIR